MNIIFLVKTSPSGHWNSTCAVMVVCGVQQRLSVQTPQNFGLYSLVLEQPDNSKRIPCWTFGVRTHFFPFCGTEIIINESYVSIIHVVISVDILIDHLNNCVSINDTSLQWLKSYLKDRSFYLGIGNSRSAISSRCCGVTQGSVLGPIKFFLLILGLVNRHNISTSLQMIL